MHDRQGAECAADGTCVKGHPGARELNNGGGAWDNAKKHIEAGAHGGKYITGLDGLKMKNPTPSHRQGRAWRERP
jgi:Na+/H+-translocating membrane pyrophosphatase